jgi:hypothetical protein
MAQQTINIGTAPNDGTGTPLRTSFDYCNLNFTELYTAVGPSGNNIVVPGSATITGDLTVDTSTLKVDSANNRVGIGIASPIDVFQVSSNNPSVYITDNSIAGSDQANLYFGLSNVPTYAGILVDILNDIFNIRHNSSTRLSIGSTGIFTWQNVGGVAGTAMTLNATGLGVGVTPSAWGSNNKALQVGANSGAISSSGSGNTSSRFSHGCYFDGTNWLYSVSSVGAARYEITGANAGSSHAWHIAAGGTAGNAITFTQAMTLDASGNLLVGTTSNSPGGTQSQFVNEWSGGVKWGSTFNQTISSATPYTHIAFCTNGTVRGSIDVNNTTITYGTVSDYRLKENVQPISNALTRIAALKPSTYKWKDSGTDGEGFIAHELASVVPLAVIGQKDALNEDGTIKAQQIDLSKVVPILVAAIKELTARVEALEA